MSSMKLAPNAFVRPDNGREKIKKGVAMNSALLTLQKAEQSQPTVGLERVQNVRAAGMLPGTKIMTSIGAQPVERIPIGARVLTYDGGLQNVLGIETYSLPKGEVVITVPKGFLGNGEKMRFLPNQELVFDNEMAQEAFVEPFTLISAEELVGHWGIKRAEVNEPLTVTQLHFSQDEVVWSDIGALFNCPKADVRRSIFEDLAA